MKSEGFNKNLIKTKIKDRIDSGGKTGILIYMVAIIVIIFVATMIIYTATGESRVEKHNISLEKKANEHLYLGEMDKAIEQYNEIKVTKEKDSTQFALKNLYIADAYSLKGDLVNYNKYIKLAKETNPKDDEVLNRLVFSQYINGDIGVALKEGEVALGINPNNKQLVKTMIAVYIANDKKDQAEKLVSSYNVDKSSAYEMAEYSGIIMVLGDYKNGLDKLREAWKINKDEYKIYDILAQNAVYNKGKFVNEIKKLQEDNPEDEAYKMWLAKIYSLETATSKEAEKLVVELKKKNVNGIEIKLIEAAVLQNLNKEKEGDKLIGEVLEKNNDDYSVLHTAGWLYLKKHMLKEAMDYCRKSIEQNENYPDNYAFLMPEILKNMEDGTTAVAYYQTGILKEPYNYKIILAAANYYWNSEQNTDKAIQYFKLASKIKPDEPEIKYNMALLYFNENRDDEAVQALKESIKLKPTSVKYHRTLGTVYLTIGKAKEGIEETRAAYKYDKNDILTLNNAGCYYIMYTDDFNKANTNLKKAFEGIDKNTNEYTKKIIKENYDNVKAIVDKIQKSKGNEDITIPDFRLLY